jgi:hypothetical protein
MRQKKHKLRCRRCKKRGVPRLAQNGPHRTAYCTRCGAYIKHIGQPKKVDSTYVPPILDAELGIKTINPGDETRYKVVDPYRRQIKRKDY